MKKVKKILASPIVTVAAFALAVGLLLFSSIGGARAALTFYSENYVSDIEMSEIGVALLENGTVKSGDEALLTNMLKNAEGEDVKLQLGKHYTENLNVQNTGSINQYVRVSVYKYWMTKPDANGKQEKTQELSPELIQLALNGEVLNPKADGTGTGRAALQANGWLVDDAACTDERMILYYSRPLAADETGEGNGEASTLFTDALAIDGKVAQNVTKVPVDGKPGSFTITYDYDGYEFYLDVQVDAVQDHNAADAILSAWGRKVSIDGNGILSLQ